MKFTHASVYAFKALAYLAKQKADAPLVASHLIAKACGIPERFILKIFKQLGNAGVLKSTKGPNGGYKLAKPASDVTLLEILEAVDGPMQGDLPQTYTDEEPAEGARVLKKLTVVVEEDAKLRRSHYASKNLDWLAK